MAIFVVLAPADNVARVGAALQKNYPGKFLVTWEGQWLLSSEGTAKNVCDKLGITGGVAGNGMVFAASGYWGHASNAFWEWLKVNWG